MRHMARFCLLWFSLATVGLWLSRPSLAASPMERMDYWQKNFDELRALDDPRAARAHAIFTRVLQAAGRRPGVVPRLFITKEAPLGVTLPMAIPDGGIILSKRVIDMCYRDPHRGDDRLAFVLGHEMAHLLKDDFWHMKFFQAIQASRAKAPQSAKALDTVLPILKSTDQIEAKELQADEHGIIYAAMAGFNTRAIVSEDNRTNFFVDWMQALDSGRSPGLRPASSHPGPIQRAAVVKARLRQVMDKVEVFTLGLRFYQTGQYARAILAFQDFVQFFPSREVYHNLAVSHHQLALQYAALRQTDAAGLPFKLSVAVDPVTRAGRIALRGRSGPRQDPGVLYRQHLDRAIGHYQTALSLDPTYALAYNNLGCALLSRGEVYKAIGTFQDALKLAPDAPDTLNNLGVAFFQAENPRNARAYLQRAHRLAPGFGAPLFNLGKIAYDGGRLSEARRYWQAYLQRAVASPWADAIRQRLALADADSSQATPSQTAVEHLMGIQVGYFEDEVPRAWGRPKTLSLSLEQDPFKIALYANGVMTLSQEGEILLIGTSRPFNGTSARGAAIGSSVKQLLARYGKPRTILQMTRGDSWVYPTPGIAFQIRANRVVSWLLF